MPADQSVFAEAMKKASNAAWDRDWAAAIEEYRRALREFPDDTAAHGGMALALEESGRPDEALAEYKSWSKLQPNDPVPVNHAALLYERLGKRAEGEQAYLLLADLYCAARQMNKAVEAWRHAVSLDPDRADTHEKLAGAFNEAGHSTAAAQEYVALARIYRRNGETARAEQAAGQALVLDADNGQARALVAELKGQGPRTTRIVEGSPVEQAQRSSLSRLAQTVFDEGPRWNVSQSTADGSPSAADLEALTAKAIDAQTHGRVPEAIDSYQQLVNSGVSRNDVFFNLGILYQSAQRYPEAVEMLKRTSGDPQFSLASYLALGNSYQAMDKSDAAMDSYVQAMQVLDLSTVQRDQVDDVIQLYQSLAAGYRGRGAGADAESFMNSLVEFLNGRGWQDKVRQVRDHMQAAADSGAPVNLAEILEANDSDKVLESLRLSQQYVKQGLLNSASDEALRAIEIAPDYLPAHFQLAEILELERRFPEAREKFEMLAETAQVRGDLPKAIAFSKRALALAPEDMNRRSKLIDLLVRQGQAENALEEYAALGAALEKTGQPRKAQDNYLEGLSLAERIDSQSKGAAVLRTRLAESYVRARDWKNAIAILERSLSLAPRDERSRFLLADLYYRVHRREEGDSQVDELIRGCGKNTARARAILSALAKNLPKEPGVNIRLARSLAASGETGQAVEMLDRLGDDLLARDERAQAIAVIEEIIALAPPQVDEYRTLLGELKNADRTGTASAP